MIGFTDGGTTTVGEIKFRKGDILIISGKWYRVKASTWPGEPVDVDAMSFLARLRARIRPNMTIYKL